MSKKVLVVDLDGTLYGTNTFHQYLKFLVKHAFTTTDLSLLFKLFVVIFFRATRVVSHQNLKYQVLKAVADSSSINHEQFVNSLSKYKRSLDKFTQDNFDITILATAAPVVYSKIIAEQYGFDWCCATVYNGQPLSEEFETVKEQKLKQLETYLSERNITAIDTVVTDHIDDLPLVKAAKNNILVCPKNYFKQELKRLNIAFTIICKEL